MTENPMNEDLLTRIQRETHERLRELRSAVDEHERLQAELIALRDVTDPLADPEPPTALKVVPEPGVITDPPAGLNIASELPATPEVASEPPVDPELSVAPELSVVPAPPANVTRLPPRRPLSRTRMVSPKVARLMRAPRRPALERSGVVRVSTRESSPLGDDLFPGVDPPGIDEVDVEAERYEHSL